jgi:hypothetical protein
VQLVALRIMFVSLLLVLIILLVHRSSEPAGADSMIFPAALSSVPTLPLRSFP